MDEDLVCYYCLTNSGSRRTPLTQYRGTLLCEECALTTAITQRELESDMQAMIERARERW